MVMTLRLRLRLLLWPRLIPTCKSFTIDRCSVLARSGIHCASKRVQPVVWGIVSCSKNTLHSPAPIDHSLQHNIIRHSLQHNSQGQCSSTMTNWFRSGLSCETQLVEAVHNWAASMNKCHQTDLILLDFSKALDCVPHHGINDSFTTMESQDLRSIG